MANSVSSPRRKPRFKERNSAVKQPIVEQRPPVPAPPPVRRRPALRALPRITPLPQITLEHGLYATIFVVGMALRLWDLGSRAMHGDEAVHAWLAWNLYNGTGYQYDPVYHGPLQFPVTALFYFLFGVSNFSGRLMSVLFGSALVFLPYFLRREMSRPAALLASALIAVGPAFVYISRLERDDSFTVLFAMTIAISIWGYLRTERVRFIYLGAACIALSLSAMENTYITLFVFGSWLLVVFASEYLDSRPLGERLAGFWRRTASGGRVSAALYAAALGAVLLAFLLTIFTGLYPPVPLVVGILLIGLVHRQAILRLRDEDASSTLSSARAVPPVVWLNAATIIIAILFLFFSTFGSNMRGIWDATQPLWNTGSACPGNSFPLNPCRKDIIGGLFYWLSQHKVARGGQPWFYYSLLFGLYQQIAVIFGLGGVLWYLRRPTLFTSFLTWWAVLTFGIYSWAGEKFSWLMIHPLLPFTLIASMFIVDLLRHALAVRYVAAVVAAALVLLELHNMYEVNFVNGADPVEMMVYVQSSPQTPVVAANILSLSHKVTMGNDLHVTVDADDTWPFAWYLRDMPNAAYPNSTQLLQPPYSTNPVIIVDESHQAALLPQLSHSYTGHEYRLRWWFPEDYKTMSWGDFFSRAVNPGYWSVITQWFFDRRPFGPKQSVNFYYYVKNGLASPY